MPHQPFPTAMRLWATLAAPEFQRRFFDPNRTYRAAFAYLEDLLQDMGDEQFTRRVWHYLRPTALSVREWVLAGGDYAPHWEHDLAVDAAVTRSWETPIRPLEPFHRYLAAAGTVHITSENWRGVLTHRNPGHARKFFDARTVLAGICVNGHRVSMSAVKGIGENTNFTCAYCSKRIPVPGETDITMTHPGRAAWFDTERNGDANPTDYVATSGRRLAWVCPLGHNYTRSVATQCKAEQPCAVCSNWDLDPDVNSVAVLAPQLVPEWHPALNERSPRDVKASTTEFAWFLCLEGHPPYRANVGARMKGTRCRLCSIESNAARQGQLIAEVRPDLEDEWDPVLNGGLPFSELRGSVRTIRTWRCKNGHVTEKSTYHRIRRGCGLCTGHISNQTSNALTRYPLIMSEFDEEANRIPANQLRVDTRYFWRCAAAGHLNKSTLHNRRTMRGCPLCAKEKRIAFGQEKGAF